MMVNGDSNKEDLSSSISSEDSESPRSRSQSSRMSNDEESNCSIDLNDSQVHKKKSARIRDHNDDENLTVYDMLSHVVGFSTLSIKLGLK